MRHVLLPILTLSLATAVGQSYHYQYFSEASGLSCRFVYTLNQDKQGYILAGTSEGLFRFDGLSFEHLEITQGLRQAFITCSFSQSADTIWFGHHDGSFMRYTNGHCTPYTLPARVNSPVSVITSGTGDYTWVCTQHDGVFRFDTQMNFSHWLSGLEGLALYDFEPTGGNRYWLATDQGLYLGEFNDEGNVKLHSLQGLEYSAVNCITRIAHNSVLVGTADRGAFEILEAGSNPTAIPLQCEDVQLSETPVWQMAIDNDKALWIYGPETGLLRFGNRYNNIWNDKTVFIPPDHPLTGSIHHFFFDREGVLWLASKGEGLVKLNHDFFSFHTLPGADSPAVVSSMCMQTDSLFIATSQGVFLSPGFENPGRAVPWHCEGLPRCAVTALLSDGQNGLWIGTAEQGLFVLKPGAKRVERIMPVTENAVLRINHLARVGQSVYCSTNSGIYVFQGGKLAFQLSMQSGLPYNMVYCTYHDRSGRTWIGTVHSAVCYIHEGIINQLDLPATGAAVDIRCIAEDADGRVWMGTAGRGVLMYDGKSLKEFNTTKGLHSNYCYSIASDLKGQIWVAHRGALSRINSSKGSIQVFGALSGADCDFQTNSILKSPKGSLLFGTSGGLLLYDVMKDARPGLEPITHFKKILINDVYYEPAKLIELGYDRYNVEFSFTGISMKNPERVTYQYYLEGLENEWCKPTTTSGIRYPRLGPGVYTFKVKAFDSEGTGGTTVHEVLIKIAYPIWQKWWFILAVFVLVALAISAFIRRREKFLRQNQEFLQRELEARTGEVMRQKELLEIQNKDITDSIHYAKNIQKAILPPPGSLLKYFPDSFVIYKPRDIVSGDFYWLHQCDDKLLLACADCTGHGVPGAFMSLIGSTLLNEVVQQPVLPNPAQVLKSLDKELNELVNRKDNVFSVDDGMDISLIEIHLKTHSVLFASANRPIITRLDGKWREWRGERHTIGGVFRVGGKNFDIQEIQMRPGDLLYMFSDGFTDQFGGPENKKLKRSGLRKMLEQVQSLPMKIQETHLRELLSQWRGSNALVDDIIFIGIRF